jgi:hypothetical protein
VGEKELIIKIRLLPSSLSLSPLYFPAVEDIFLIMLIARHFSGNNCLVFKQSSACVYQAQEHSFLSSKGMYYSFKNNWLVLMLSWKHSLLP